LGVWQSHKGVRLNESGTKIIDEKGRTDEATGRLIRIENEQGGVAERETNNKKIVEEKG